MNFEQYQNGGHDLYGAFAAVVANILETRIREKPCFRFQQATKRPKDPASLKKKLEKEGARERPDIEDVIKDLAGCRLIFYTNSDVTNFLTSGILQEKFTIVWSRTRFHHPVPLANDKPPLFRSHNFVVELGEELAARPELAKYGGLRCEVQVQTILDHAWAEMEHDILYKRPSLDGFGGDLMKSIEERLQKVMRDYLIPAGYEFQKVVADFERLSGGKALLDERPLRRIEDAKDNNELHEQLTSFNESVLPHYNDRAAIQGDIRKTLLSTLRSATSRNVVPIETVYGQFDGHTMDQIMDVACDIIDSLRYLGEEAVTGTLDALCSLYSMATSDVQNGRVLASAKRLAGYVLNVWKQVGPTVQIILVERIRQMHALDRNGCRPVIVKILGSVLSPEIKGSASTYNAITLTTAAASPTDALIAVRTNAIEVLLALLGESPTNQERRLIISELFEASRTPNLGGYANELVVVTYRDTARIIQAMTELLPTFGYLLIEHLEHDCLWQFRRSKRLPARMDKDKNIFSAREELHQAIGAFRERANSDQSFVIFKTLVGYESVFPPAWESDEFDIQEVDEYRTKAVAELVGQVTSETAEEWFQRITTCAEVQSDDSATFPRFRQFLERLALAQPAITWTYIDREHTALAQFLDCFLTGFERAGEREAVIKRARAWVHEGAHLQQILRYCLLSGSPDFPLLEDATAAAIRANDAFGLYTAVEASVTHGKVAPDGFVERNFLPAIQYLSARGNFMWVRALWPRREGKDLLVSLTTCQDDMVLECLVAMSNIDHYAEEVLKAIGGKSPDKVIDFFRRRLDYEHKADIRRYDPIPYEFHELGTVLSAVPDRLVAKARDWYNVDPKLFAYRGGKIISATFPEPDPSIVKELHAVVAKGKPEDFRFVLQVLQIYKGEVELHPLLQQIVDAVPDDSDVLVGVSVALNQTGVLRGEFGFVEANLRKKSEMETWLTYPREKVRKFANERISTLERQIAEEQRRAEQSLELRKREYGE
jgi:ppGpp synthetase/RelA/SpoT-type nucleotidyltranferase